ncbi:hypothetical protein [Burkholderia cepacia]|uniref:hypothetical protein n=1 Tax=Burkholderia cepacia TaxID=292 RepID=UPI002ABE6CC4|nr:hypothetical protein [Burkholderia cepacia]
MRRAVAKDEELAALKKARVDHAIRSIVIAAVLSDPKGVHELLELTPAELGRRFRSRMWDISGVVTLYGYDLAAHRKEGEDLRRRIERLSKSTATAAEPMTEAEKANPERYPLILQNKLLREEDFCLATSITKKKLEKDVAACRVLSVEFGQEPFYPAFFIPELFDRKDFAKVFRRLDGLPAWSKWDFLTSPVASQEGSTPLQLLMVESIEQAVRAADEFTRQFDHATLPKRSRK